MFDNAKAICFALSKLNFDRVKPICFAFRKLCFYNVVINRRMFYLGWFYKLALLDFELIFEPERSQKITKRIS